MRTKFTAHSNSKVTIEYDSVFCNERIIEIYWVPAAGGYVRSGEEQVCDNLSSRGSTLHLSNPNKYPLIDLIRREYKSMRRAEQKLIKDY